MIGNAHHDATCERLFGDRRKSRERERELRLKPCVMIAMTIAESFIVREGAPLIPGEQVRLPISREAAAQLLRNWRIHVKRLERNIYEHGRAADA